MIKSPRRNAMTEQNEEFYKDVEAKLKTSGNYLTPKKKEIELRKGVKRFIMRKLDEEATK